MKKIIIISVLVSVYLLIRPVFVFSQTTFQPQIGVGNEFPTTRATEVTGLTFAQYVIAFYTYMIRAIAIIAVVMIVVAGFKWVLSRGNASAITQAKDQMFSAIIGLILIVGANLILSFINPALVRFQNLNPKPIEKINTSTLIVGWGPNENQAPFCTIEGRGKIKLSVYFADNKRYENIKAKVFIYPPSPANRWANCENGCGNGAGGWVIGLQNNQACPDGITGSNSLGTNPNKLCSYATAENNNFFNRNDFPYAGDHRLIPQLFSPEIGIIENEVTFNQTCGRNPAICGGSGGARSCCKTTTDGYNLYRVALAQGGTPDCRTVCGQEWIKVDDSGFCRF
jgi:hypothetical protein